ncbi:Probable permease of ABC transporter OS=Blastopirellula marina DSM 3645 GN=DSM3645_18876 PE=4 SV=1: Permease [Gemmataceae bacterium]|nr:Probable permease of ABC transporter OS=Blastopirellula marina DSM 3645 GN=DSM3645_18876 PE=4 SV=1: Permease [Gemmataceae bacterium]VTU02100.1 Probable permease of ABC transporter OS=Blastopirellula marina DSM 3645 GN=DSM3645_18876 PE=4 SV=1: Permease [Gemmataceae bacterium]
MSAEPATHSPLSPLAEWAVALGDWTLFAARATRGVAERAFRGRELLRVAFQVGYASAGVVGVTGLFIGMVLAVQAYGQFHTIGLETSLGAIIHMSVVRELGPVLAAIMLSGRVGSAMAAELATMRVTEQLDALACLGVDPVKYLVAPRLLACVLLAPLLTVLADLLGLAGSTLISLYVYQIDGHHYWRHTQEFVKVWDVFTGLVKAVIFGGVLSLIACHRGFHGRAGAEGVGRAATEAFVWSFVAILVIDLFLAMFANTLYSMLWPPVNPRVA